MGGGRAWVSFPVWVCSVCAGLPLAPTSKRLQRALSSCSRQKSVKIGSLIWSWESLGYDRYWFRLTFSVLFILAHISYSFLHYCSYSSECYSSFHCYTFSSSPEGEYIYGTLLCLLVYIRTWHSQFTFILLLLLVVNTSFMIDPVSFISHLASVSSGHSLTTRSHT